MNREPGGCGTSCRSAARSSPLPDRLCRNTHSRAGASVGYDSSHELSDERCERRHAPMSRFAGMGAPGPRKRPQWPQDHPSSIVSHDHGSIESPSSPGSVSTLSTLRDDRRRKSQKFCTVSVNDGYSKDEALLNLDHFADDIVPGMLMAIIPVRNDLKNTTAVYGSGSKQVNDTFDSPSPASAAKSSHDNDIGHTFIFVAQDMSKEMKARYPDGEIHIAKHIADAFGLKKGSSVIMRPVSQSPFEKRKDARTGAFLR